MLPEHQRPPEDGDWAAWSQASVAQLQARCDALLKRNHIARNAQYRWDLESATARFRSRKGPVTFGLQCVGSVFDGTFLWAWANASIPAVSTERLSEVQAFGQANGLGLLTEREFDGDHGAAVEMLAVSGRVLDAQGFWIDSSDDTSLYFLLFQAPRG